VIFLEYPNRNRKRFAENRKIKKLMLDGLVSFARKVCGGLCACVVLCFPSFSCSRSGLSRDALCLFAQKPDDLKTKKKIKASSRLPFSPFLSFPLPTHRWLQLVPNGLSGPLLRLSARFFCSRFITQLLSLKRIAAFPNIMFGRPRSFHSNIALKDG